MKKKRFSEEQIIGHGISDRNEMEWVTGMEWNPWPGSSGICSLVLEK